MEKSKVKNYILLLLALVNVFLLCLVVSDAIDEHRTEVRRIALLSQVLEDNGISLDSDAEISSEIPAQISLTRDLTAEKRNISSLIGRCTAQDEGGNLYFYSGTDGLAEFSGTGEFDIVFTSPTVSRGNDPVDTAKATLSKINIEYADIEPIVINDETCTIVTLFSSYDGIPIYNAKIEFTFNEAYLISISGTRALDRKNADQYSPAYLDSTTMLMHFLDTVNTTGYVCSEIKSLKLEYYMYPVVSGSCNLMPVWIIQTNSAIYYFNAETGEVQSIEAAA